jgi:hypothetical protein
MKRLLDEAAAPLGGLGELVASAERHQVSPFSKRHVYSRILRELEERTRRSWLRPAFLGVGALLVAATAAAAGYTILAPSSAPLSPSPSAIVEPPREPVQVAPPARVPAELPPPPAEVKPEKPSERRVEKAPRAGEDPTQVAEAVRALRKQGDAARAQALLDQYLKSNPRGALAEDALALSIEAAAARKDPRAAEYARRYLARYPSGRFRAMAERVLAK